MIENHTTTKLWCPVWSRVLVWVSLLLAVANSVRGFQVLLNGLKGGWLADIGIAIGLTILISSVLTLVFGVCFIGLKKLNWFIIAGIPILFSFIISFSLLLEITGWAF